jgi:hypothetical protein
VGEGDNEGHDPAGGDAEVSRRFRSLLPSPFERRADSSSSRITGSPPKSNPYGLKQHVSTGPRSTSRFVPILLPFSFLSLTLFLSLRRTWPGAPAPTVAPTCGSPLSNSPMETTARSPRGMGLSMRRSWREPPRRARQQQAGRVDEDSSRGKPGSGRLFVSLALACCNSRSRWTLSVLLFRPARSPAKRRHFAST